MRVVSSAGVVAGEEVRNVLEEDPSRLAVASTNVDDGEHYHGTANGGSLHLIFTHQTQFADRIKTFETM